MPTENEIWELLVNAERNEQIAYDRYLWERFSEFRPDFVPGLIRYACNLISLAQYDAAKDALDRAEKLATPGRLHHVLAQRGHLLQAQGDLAAAEAMFMRAHELDPDDATYLIYAGSAAFQKGDLERAIALARRAAACSEGCLDEAHFNLGSYLLSERRYAEAAECYRKALEVDSDYKLAKERLADVELILASLKDFGVVTQ